VRHFFPWGLIITLILVDYISKIAWGSGIEPLTLNLNEEFGRDYNESFACFSNLGYPTKFDAKRKTFFHPSIQTICLSI